jgi:hypothetical protein
MHSYLSSNVLRVWVFLMNMLQTYLDWWIWRMTNYMEWKVMTTTCIYKHSFHLHIRIYCQKGYLKINHFFRDICSKKLHTQHIEKLETNIIQKIWKLEMIFPSSFFDLMEHLPINLLFEVKIWGIVRYTWMHPFKRLGITQLS